MIIPNDQISQRLYSLIKESVFSGEDADATTLLLHWIEGIKTDVKLDQERSTAQAGRVTYGFLNVKQNREYRVMVKDYSTFCSENKLDPAKMGDVAMGNVKEYKGWQRARTLGNIIGSEYREPQPLPEEFVQEQRKVEEPLRIKWAMSHAQERKQQELPTQVSYQPKGAK